MLSIGDCGIMLEPQFGMTMEQLIRTSRQAEELGFGYLFRSDHLLPTDGSRGMDSPECWTSLGAVAAATKTLKFGPLVTPIGFRNPAMLAKMACTLHAFSGGRIQLAVGAGWYEPEYRAHGYSFPSFEVRKKQFIEALGIILPMVREGRVDFDGDYFSAHTDCLPRPAGRMHVIIGAKSKSLVRLAGKVADEWNIFSTPMEVFEECKAILDDAREGRNVIISQMSPFLIGTSKADLLASAGKQLAKFGRNDPPDDLLSRVRRMNAPCGTVEEFVDQVGRLVDAGIRRLYFQVLDPENKKMTELLAQTLKGSI